MELNCGTKSNPQDLNIDYWQSQWEQKNTAWDIGYPSPAIQDFFKDIENKNAKILIPGCGNAHEAEALLAMGFTSITLIDIAPKVVEILNEKFKHQDEISVLCEDFFVHLGTYDFIIEQTFFCALDPLSRKNYVTKMHELLADSGQLVGLLFNKIFEKQGPPFGGSTAEYHFLFKKYFDIVSLDPTDKSIPERLGSEVWMQMIKK